MLLVGEPTHTRIKEVCMGQIASNRGKKGQKGRKVDEMMRWVHREANRQDYLKQQQEVPDCAEMVFLHILDKCAGRDILEIMGEIQEIHLFRQDMLENPEATKREFEYRLLESMTDWNELDTLHELFGPDMSETPECSE